MTNTTTAAAIETKTWKTVPGAIKAIEKAGLDDTHEAVELFPNGGIVARPKTAPVAEPEPECIVLDASAEPEHECIVWDAPIEPEPETTAEQAEVAVSEAFPVVWPESVAKLFFRALAKDGAEILASAYGLVRQANQAKLVLTITGDPEKAAWLAERLPTRFVVANESLKQWRKTSPNYKCHSLATTEGRRDAYAAEQDYLRGFCWAVAGTFTNDMLASDGVQAGLAYLNDVPAEEL